MRRVTGRSSPRPSSVTRAGGAGRPGPARRELPGWIPRAGKASEPMSSGGRCRRCRRRIRSAGPPGWGPAGTSAVTTGRPAPCRAPWRPGPAPRENSWPVQAANPEPAARRWLFADQLGPHFPETPGQRVPLTESTAAFGRRQYTGSAATCPPGARPSAGWLRESVHASREPGLPAWTPRPARAWRRLRHTDSADGAGNDADGKRGWSGALTEWFYAELCLRSTTGEMVPNVVGTVPSTPTGWGLMATKVNASGGASINWMSDDCGELRRSSDRAAWSAGVPVHCLVLGVHRLWYANWLDAAQPRG